MCDEGLCVLEEIRSALRLEGQQSKQRLGERSSDRRAPCVADHMTSNISVVSPETTVSEARYLCTAMNVAVMVVYQGARYVGFIDASLLKRSMQNPGYHFDQVRVQEIMDTDVRPCSPYDSLWDVRHRMHHSGQSYLPVIDEGGRLAGVLASQAMEPQR